MPDAAGSDPYLPTFLASGYAGPVEQVVVTDVQADAAAMMRRAAKLGATKRCAKRSATEVVHRLIGRADAQDETFVIRCGSRTVGHWRRDGKGRAVVTLNADVSEDAAMARVVAGIQHALGGGVQT